MKEVGRGGTGARFMFVFYIFCVALVVATAIYLKPSPSGHGTHTQLGLPPCGFLMWTGYPCPGCGLTTSFAHMVRFDVIDAWSASPFGVFLFSAMVASAGLAGVGLKKKWSVGEAFDRGYVDRVMLVVAVVGMVSWIVRMTFIYLARQ